jgi:hypothetical protein
MLLIIIILVGYATKTNFNKLMKEGLIKKYLLTNGLPVLFQLQVFPSALPEVWPQMGNSALWPNSQPRPVPMEGCGCLGM